MVPMASHTSEATSNEFLYRPKSLEYSATVSASQCEYGVSQRHHVEFWHLAYYNAYKDQ